MKISSATIAASLDLTRQIAKDNGVPIEKAVAIHLAFLEKTATEKSDPETREAARVLIRNIFESDPHADFDAKEVAQRVGLKPVQSDSAFVRHQLKTLRLEFKKAA